MAIDTTKAVTGASTDAIKNFVKMVSDHRNLLDNPWFTVNQRGSLAYFYSSYSNHYTVDRWQMNNVGQVSLASPYGVILYDMNINGWVLRQVLEVERIKPLMGKAVTLSVLSNGNVYSNSVTLPSTANGDVVSVTLSNNFTCSLGISSSFEGYLKINHTNTSNNGLPISAVKLELGSVSTLAYDSPPNYAEELLKCQQYFVAHVKGGYGYGSGSTTMMVFYPIPVAMRVYPSLIVESFGILAGNGHIITPTNASKAITENVNTNNVVGYWVTTNKASYEVHTYVAGWNHDVSLSADL